MLNFLITVVLLNVSVLGFFFTFKINRVEQVFGSIDPGLLVNCIDTNIENTRTYFVREKVVETVVYFLDKNLEGFEYNLKFAFREDDLNTTFSPTPNIVQIDINANILFEGIYKQNVRFILSGREVSKDWWSTF